MAKRGAPLKKGLQYFPKYLTFYDDDQIFDLLDEYGPLGVTVFEVILVIVYSNGYYVELSKDKLARMVIKKIGNKWIKGQKTVVQVIDYCADIGLLSKDLLGQNVITSVGIQESYLDIVTRLKRQFHIEEYWLLRESAEPLLSAEKKEINAEINVINSELNTEKTEEIPMKEKESKENYIYTFSSKELELAFRMYVVSQRSNGVVINQEQIKLLIEELNNLSDKEEEKIAIVKKATMKGWKSFWPLKKPKSDTPKTNQSKGKNNFNNFDGRAYDMTALEKELLK